MLGWPACHPPTFIGAGNDCLVGTLPEPRFIFASFSAVSKTPNAVLPLQMEAAKNVIHNRSVRYEIMTIVNKQNAKKVSDSEIQPNGHVSIVILIFFPLGRAL